MSWLSQLAGNVWGGLTSLGKAIVNATAPVVATVVDTLRRGVEAVQEALKKEFRPPPANERERIERDLQDVNERIMRLRKRYYQNGGLSDGEKRHNARLLEERAELVKELDALDQAEAAEDIVAEEEKYGSVEISNELTHILQFHVGQFTYNKSCRRCGRAMILQTNQSTPVAATHNFFWSCIGFYDAHRQCKTSLPITADDLTLFVNLKRPEFEVTPADLADIAIRHRARIESAMDAVIGKSRKTSQGIAGYRCPVHKERLIPRRKKVDSGLLDRFLLGCPHYSADGNGCNYIVKLKTPAQLSAVLEASGEGGLIQVIH